MRTTDVRLQSGSEISLRPLALKDLPAVAKIHIAAFKHSAISMLGDEAVRRYYEWQLLGPHSCSSCGAFVGNECVGFCLGGVFRGSTSGFLKENRNYLIWKVLTHPWLLKNETVIKRIKLAVHVLWKTARHQRTVIKRKQKRTTTFGILALAVNPKMQRSGIGRLLMDQQEAVARQNCFYEMVLTVAPENEQAINLYQSLGWEKVSTKGRWQGEMRKSLLTN